MGCIGGSGGYDVHADKSDGVEIGSGSPTPSLPRGVSSGGGGKLEKATRTSSNDTVLKRGKSPRARRVGVESEMRSGEKGRGLIVKGLKGDAEKGLGDKKPEKEEAGGGADELNECELGSGSTFGSTSQGFPMTAGSRGKEAEQQTFSPSAVPGSSPSWTNSFSPPRSRPVSPPLKSSSSRSLSPASRTTSPPPPRTDCASSPPADYTRQASPSHSPRSPTSTTIDGKNNSPSLHSQNTGWATHSSTVRQKRRTFLRESSITVHRMAQGESGEGL